MKASHKHTPGKPAIKSLYVIFIVLIVLQSPFIKGAGNKNISTHDAAYSLLTNELIKSNLESCQNQVVWLEGIELRSAPLICNFYEKNKYNPAWTFGNEPTKQALTVIQLFKDSYKYGFEPSNFDILSLEQYIHLLLKEEQVKKSAKIRVSFEFLMTHSLFTFMAYLTQGIEYSNIPGIFIQGNQVTSNFPDHLMSIISSDNIVANILKLQPKDPEYISLQNEMEDIMENILTPDNTVCIPDIATDSERYCRLFSYIFAQNGLSSDEVDLSDPEVFSSMLIKFQDISGIRASGTMNNATRRAISQCVRSRYEVIATKLETIRKRAVFDKTLISFNY